MLQEKDVLTITRLSKFNICVFIAIMQFNSRVGKNRNIFMYAVAQHIIGTAHVDVND